MIFSQENKIEPEYAEAYKVWQKTRGPAANADILKTLHPVIEGAVRTHVGQVNPLLMGRAKLMTLQGLETYSPSAGKLKTHLYSQLQGLKRINRKQTQIISVPERVSLERSTMQKAEQSLSHELGRDPTDEELSDYLGVSGKRLRRLRETQYGIPENYFLESSSSGEEPGESASSRLPGRARRALWQKVVYDELDPYHKKVMELSMGLNGRTPLQNQEIAKRLRRSPGAISQAKARIQAKLQEGDELSPFYE